jgi:hypothetical protein
MRTGKSFLFWIFIVGGTAFACFSILAGVYLWMSGRELDKKLAELRAAGEPLCLADLDKPVPADGNGALYLLEAKADAEAVETKIYALKEPADGNYPPADREKIHAYLAAYPKILPLLQKAAAAPEFRFPQDFHVKPSQFLASYLLLSQIQRSCIRYLHNYAQDLLYQGKRDEALRTTLLMLQLARQYDRDCTTLTSYLVSIACKGIALDCGNEILQSGQIDEKLRAALEAELARHDSLDACRAAMKSERAYCLDAMQNDLPADMLSIQRTQWQLCALEMFEDFYKYSSQPYSMGVSKGYRQPPSGFGSAFSGPAALMLPAWKSVMDAAFRSQALTRSLRIINALQGKSPVGGKIPSMAELGLPKEVGIDPFNGRPLTIKKLPAGWMVYSVGRNLQDDGGKFDPFEDTGFGPKILKAENGEKEKASLEEGPPKTTLPVQD